MSGQIEPTKWAGQRSAQTRMPAGLALAQASE
jgi:hypothetical protein